MVVDKIVVGNVPLLCSCDIIICIVKDHTILDCMGIQKLYNPTYNLKTKARKEQPIGYFVLKEVFKFQTLYSDLQYVAILKPYLLHTENVIQVKRSKMLLSVYVKGNPQNFLFFFFYLGMNCFL